MSFCEFEIRLMEPYNLKAKVLVYYQKPLIDLAKLHQHQWKKSASTTFYFVLCTGQTADKTKNGSLTLSHLYCRALFLNQTHQK